MKKLYRLSLIAFISILTISFAFAQNPGRKSLGNTKAFSKTLKDQLSPASSNKSANQKCKVAISDHESFSLKVNHYMQGKGEDQYLVGEVENKVGGSFLINVSGNELTGNIIFKNENKAFKYYSDSKGNAYVEPVDINQILCVSYAKPVNEPKSSGIPVTSAAMPDLQSLPGARGCVLLDFDGHYSVSGWNNGNPINAAHSGMSDAAMQEAWEIVAEDFRPFNLNITTNEAVFNSYPRNMRMRCIITPTNTAAPGAGGVAYLGSFSWNDDNPCWVFLTTPKYAAEAASHEIGHTFDLLHDGRTSPNEGYFAGHGDWAPIMGAGYYKPITQWSKGEYNFANQRQDDVAIIAGSKFGVGFRGDDHSNGPAGSTVLTRNGTSLSGSGIITNEADWDFFTIHSGAGTISITGYTVHRHGNLDIILRLYNSSGTLIASANNPGLHAAVSANVAAGTYYLAVDGTGAGNPGTDGFSAYASLGSYWISGSAPVPSTPPTGIVSGGVYSLINVHSGKALEVSNFSTANGGNVQQWDYVGASSQKWRATDVGGGIYSLININSGKGLDVSNVSSADGANIYQWDYVGGNHQKWHIVPNGDGTYRILAGHSGKALEVGGFSTTNGGNVQQWAWANVNSQKWRFTQVAARLSAPEVASDIKLQVYPNPVAKSLFINSMEDLNGAQFQIITTQGKEILKGVASHNGIDVTDLRPGIYNITINANGKMITKRFIKN